MVFKFGAASGPKTSTRIVQAATAFFSSASTSELVANCYQRPYCKTSRTAHHPSANSADRDADGKACNGRGPTASEAHCEFAPTASINEIYGCIVELEYRSLII